MALESGIYSHVPVWIDGLSFVGIVITFTKGSEWLNGLLNDEGRSAISRWLKNSQSAPQDEAWPTALSSLIDRVFGDRPFSWKFFARSSVASIIAAVIVFLIYIRLVRTEHWYRHFLTVIILTLAYSLIPDYFSLLVSRWIIKLVSRRPRFLEVFRLLIADAVLTGAISVVGILVGQFIVFGTVSYLISSGRSDRFTAAVTSGWSATRPLLQDIQPASLNLVKAEHRGSAIWFYSSFSTSLWLWLYVISGFSIKAAHKVRFLWVRLSKYMDIDQNPLGCIGKVSGLFLAILWACFIGAEHVLHFLKAH